MPTGRQEAIAARLELLCDDPFSPQLSKPLKGSLAQLRAFRIGNLRVLFEVREVVQVIVVTEIGPRGDIYKR
ncbi:MAG TPA: type II toxin-antitoxin system RelE/ParE family toxin [Tepidiformaceae bacterium]|nr:type II toxin-antitoxin system RelE/ParE family toxin [Tepidiformaceae bacterium]HMO96556.1 type II toxin-antitoxin system RelE/ParE family toxin [Tepidiformaceae bacterium]